MQTSKRDADIEGDRERLILAAKKDARNKSEAVKPLTTIAPTAPDSLPVSELPASGRSIGLGKLQRADGLVFICVIMWAFNVPFIKACLVYFEPLQTALIRFMTAGIIFVIYVKLVEGSLRVQRRHLGLLVLAGLVGITINQIFFTYALKNTTSSEVSLLMSATPSFATLLAWLMGQEKIRLNYWLSLPLAIAGVSLIIMTAPNVKLAGNLLGDTLALGMAATWAGYTVIIRPLLKHYSAALISAYVLLIGAVALLPLGIGQFDLSRMGSVPPHIWLALIYSALGSVVITNILWFTGVKELGAPRTAFYAYLQPFVGVFAAAVVLGETIVPWQIAGGGFVIASMILYRVRFGRPSEK